MEVPVMSFVFGWVAKLRQENTELRLQVEAMDSVWRKESVTLAVAWLRRGFQDAFTAERPE
jgi:hypothetical protein